MPEPPPTPRGPVRHAATVGAAIGLALGLLFVFLSPGQAALILVLTALGAALGVIVKNAFSDGIDPAGAWRALRRR